MPTSNAGAHDSTGTWRTVNLSDTSSRRVWATPGPAYLERTWEADDFASMGMWPCSLQRAHDFLGRTDMQPLRKVYDAITLVTIKSQRRRRI